MTAHRVDPRARVHAALLVLAVVTGCTQGSPSSVSPQPSAEGASPVAGATPTPVAPPVGSLVVVGRIMTMDDPPVSEALFIEDGVVAAVGARDEVLAAAGDGVPVIDLGDNVAYPGFIDAHAHWIGDREYYNVDTPAAAMELALERGWTSISEQWVNQERLDELERLAADHAVPLRVDAYLALNFDREFLGDWYAAREPGVVDAHLRVKGVKIHLDDGFGQAINWEPDDLDAAIARANDAGWQVSVHAMSSAAMELVLDAFEAAIGPTGPNPLHHRIEHAMQVTDDQLARLAAMDIAIVTQFDGAGDWMLDDRVIAEFDREDPGAQLPLLDRWRDFVDAGLHVATSTDAPWTFETEDLRAVEGRPFDHIAAVMDGRVRTSPAVPPWAARQLLTADQALRAVTLEAAWALGDEALRGHLAPGTWGDVTILSGDVTTATPDAIRQMLVVATIVGGIPVFCADAAMCSQVGS